MNAQFTDEETEAWKGWGACPRSRLWLMVDQAVKGGSQTPEPTLSFGYFLFLFFYVKDSPTYSRQLLDTIGKEDKCGEGLLEAILLSTPFPACSRAGLVPRPSSP